MTVSTRSGPLACPQHPPLCMDRNRTIDLPTHETHATSASDEEEGEYETE